MQSKKFYENLGKENLNNNKSNLDELDIFLLKQFEISNSNILDLGCGKGYLSHEFAKKGNSVIGVDGSNEMLNYAKKKNFNKNLKFQLLDLNEIKFNEEFDLIFAINSLVHIKNLEYIYDKIKIALRKKGQFVLCFPHPIQDLDEIKDYSKEQIIEMKTKYGIIQQYFRPINFYINSLVESGFKINRVFEFPFNSPQFFIVEVKNK